MNKFIEYIFRELEAKGLSVSQASTLVRLHQASQADKAPQLHPLLHRNTSDLAGARFSGRFDGQEFFLRDHRVQGHRVLPAAASLEFAHEAVLRAAAQEAPEESVLRLEEVAFVRPAMHRDEALELHAALEPLPGGGVGFELYSDARDGATVVHVQGRAMFVPRTVADRLDLEELRARCTDRRLGADDCYALYARMGLDYGPAFRVLQQVQAGRDGMGRPIVLASLRLDESLLAGMTSFRLHPCLLDAALQACIGMMPADADAAPGKPMLPFALQTLECLQPLTGTGWAFVRHADGSRADGPVYRLDIDITDERGQVCLRLRGFSSRVLDAAPDSATLRTLLMQPHWVHSELAPSRPGLPRDATHWVLLCDAPGAHAAGVQARLKDSCCVRIASQADGIAQRYTEYASLLLGHLQTLLSARPQGPALVQLVVPAEGEAVLLAGLSGLLKTAQQEHPQLRVQTLGVEDAVDAAVLADRLLAEAAGDLPADVRYLQGQRHRVEMRPAASPGPAPAPWREGGIYLITGGAGGLGSLFAEAIVSQARGVRLVLTGRSPVNETIEARLQVLKDLGAQAEYRCVDIGDAGAVAQLVEQIRGAHGGLHGVIHSAGVLRDSLMLKKTAQQIEEVFRPKVHGLAALDRAIGSAPLDCFVLFSSLSGAAGNVGQADYAAANAFMDAFSAHRNALAAAGARQGRTVSLNWPLWAAGGMQVDARAREQLWRSSGLVPLETEAGVQALADALALQVDQALVLSGDTERLQRTLFAPRAVPKLAPAAPASTAPPPAAGDAAGADELRAAALRYLGGLLSRSLKLPVDRIEVSKPLDEYGIDSLMVMELTAALEQSFGPLSKTLFFEYQTLEALAQYLLQSHREALAALGGARIAARTGAPNPAPVAGTRSRRRRVAAAQPQQADAAPMAAMQRPDIAIIGLSGRYPKARSVQEYWANLLQGVNCISEVPPQRWDHGAYFDAERGKPGKTYSKWGGFIDGVDEFDPLFFNISPREAVGVDPQERLFLQCVHAALEDAGYTRETLARQHRRGGLDGHVGVFAGVMYEEYQLYGAQAQALGHGFALPGNPSSIANRVSYFCNFHGPSLAVDTMCSSSLTAIHLACQSLAAGDCEVAIAGGVNVTIHPNKYLALAHGQFTSSEGLCRSFGAGGDGYVPGEGVGAVLLKPLAQALEDGDQIHGVIKASAINHGGRTNGYTVPNPNAQAQVIEQAIRAAGVHPRTISYIEAHGTGTALGDPIEIAGLSKAFGAQTQDRQYCAIGSAKSNIGHCESAAGIAGLTKVLLQMRHGQLVRSLHSEELNPHIDFGRTPFVVQRENAAWTRPVLSLDGGEPKEYPRIAGLSSFGAGGSNAHLIVEEYRGPQPARQAPAVAGPVAVVLSGRDGERLREQVVQLVDAIDGRGWSDAQLGDVAYTLQVGREAMQVRLACVVSGLQELRGKLAQWLQGGEQQEQQGLYQGDVKRGRQALEVFAADDDMQQALQAWVAKGKLDKLAQMWVQGMVVDWSRLYAGQLPRRISLPTYPFARSRYWIDMRAVQRPASAPMAPVASQESRQPVLMHKVWEPAASLSSGPAQTGRVWILCDASTTALAQALAARLGNAWLLQAGAPLPEFEDCGGWIDLIGDSQDGLLDWFETLQQLVGSASRKGLRLLGVTCGLEMAQGARARHAGAERAALYRLLSSEYVRLRSTHLDLEPQLAPAEAAAYIAAEFGHDGDDTGICVREGRRLRPTLRPAVAPAGESRVRTPAPTDVVWVTGGTRGIGLLCAQHLVRHHGIRRLVLAGREVFPPRQDWPAAMAGDKALAGKIRAILALEAEGAQVHVSAVPLTDGPALQAEVELVVRRWGAIHGVVHSAGWADSDHPAFVRKPLDRVAAVFEPKMQGLENLLACVEAQPLRFVLLFSSVSAIVPLLGAGQADYAMANAWMDQWAAARFAQLPVTSIQWGNWKDSGMGESATPAYRQSGLLSHSDAEGLALLDQVLAADWGPVVLAGVADGARWQPQRLLERMRVALPAVPAAHEPLRQSSPPLAPQAGALGQAVQDWLHGLFAEQLQIEHAEFDVQTPLQDYGVDSVLLVQLMRIVGERVRDEQLDPSVLYEHTTVKAFAHWLLGRYEAVLSESFDTPAEPAVRMAAEAAPAALLPAAALPASPGLDIAVVGMSCRFAGANSLQAYWQLLKDGRSAIARVPPQRWGAPSQHVAGLLDDVSHFDPKFFLLSEADARAMDPQALLVLEECLKLWSAAGYRQAEVKGRPIGVYLGGRSQHRPQPQALAAASNPILAVGQNYLASNVSRFFDLRGPSLVVDTACSSALVAMSLAVQGLQSGEIEAAVVGGVSLLGGEEAMGLFAQRGILNSQAQFHLFDKRAGGAVLGEGVGMVLVKTLEQARRDGDRIYAVLQGLAVNNDGRTAGPAAPNPQAQKDVMQAALRRSGWRAEDVSYIDANGSGSAVNDLLELKAIEAVYRAGSAQACYLGSMKPNIGHPLCAEGIASFIKVALMLHHRQWVPFLSAQEPMAHYDFAASPLRFNREATVWEGAPRVAGLNCFADGGTNAHAVLQSWEGDGAQRAPLAPPVLQRIDLRQAVAMPSQAPQAPQAPLAETAGIWE